MTVEGDLVKKNSLRFSDLTAKAASSGSSGFRISERTTPIKLEVKQNESEPNQVTSPLIITTTSPADKEDLPNEENTEEDDLKVLNQKLT